MLPTCAFGPKHGVRVPSFPDFTLKPNPLCYPHVLLGRSDPAPMTAPVPSGMNPSSSQFGSAAGIEVGSFFFHPPHLVQGYP
jgi:hypothetical protein